MTRERKIAFFSVALFLSIAVGLYFYGRIGQPSGYHRFAEMRPLWGIPNSLNVVSNLAFWYAAWYGLMCYFVTRDKHAHADGNGALIALIVGAAATGLGSAYYHAFPSNESLVWDRIPMTICFAAIFAEFIAIHVSEKKAKLYLIPLVVSGIATVLYWKWSGLHGADDLRPYVMVQFFPLLLIPAVALFFPIKQRHSPLWTKALLWYACAKVLEHFDQPIFAITSGTVSGHTLKHIASGIAVLYALRGMYERRQHHK